MFKANDTVEYFDERFKVVIQTGEMVFIRNEKNGYYVPSYTLRFIESAAEEKPVQKKRSKK